MQKTAATFDAKKRQNRARLLVFCRAQWRIGALFGAVVRGVTGYVAMHDVVVHGLHTRNRGPRIENHTRATRAHERGCEHGAGAKWPVLRGPFPTDGGAFHIVQALL